jgi:hypothetical protein
MAEIPVRRAARAEALEDRHPTSTLIVAGLANPAWKIEIKESHPPDCVLFVGNPEVGPGAAFQEGSADNCHEALSRQLDGERSARRNEPARPGLPLRRRPSAHVFRCCFSGFLAPGRNSGQT